ncbi:cysteine-rich receptor-like protein kinase 10 isoform X1 [Punica granatum]|uniref:non-specific serine/threonine protein kinase n=3 Tax=Punica granatum TaxID=22663 RepID=A0A6P8D1V7_PUNGR|nr:cysteine-rich receptor-like protein kinase 10 isoform X1 [Punica granatum]
MDRFSLCAIFILVLSVCTICSVSNVHAVEPLSTLCSYQYGNYSANSTFENNLKLLLQSLTSNTPITGFNDTSVGNSTAQVYGQALCRGDTNSTECRDCVKIAAQGIMSQCNKSLDALIWYERCQVRYSVMNFFSLMVYTGKYTDSNYPRNVTANPARLYSHWIYMMTNISGEAAFDPSLQMFATGVVNFTASRAIYGLVQCTRDISASDCNSCLRQALGDLRTCCYTREGGMILSRNCNVRFEHYQFYNGPVTSVLTYHYSEGNRWKKWIIVLVLCVLGSVSFVVIGYCAVFFSRRRKDEFDDERSRSALFHDYAAPVGVAITEAGDLVSSDELPFMDLTIVKAATDDFSSSNKLGQGGFGAVYKGVLSDGTEVAVKRLSRKSWQGLEEFKNEVMLIGRLKHRNLVRLIGWGMEGDEKLLIYEFMPNRSLDIFIFDPEKRTELDWRTCYLILDGIARGLVYLHEDSRHKIIHRDLKPSNVLLDCGMEAKISDFGMARIFGEKQITANTKRVVGTYGYMAPEYAMGGHFSVKSDVFSFGVVMLEIISGKRNNGFYLTELAQTLLAYAWKLWQEGKELEFVDPSLLDSGSTSEIVRCVQIGLLCVQEDPADRPTMSEVVTLLGSEMRIPPEPKQPAYSVGRVVPVPDQSSGTGHSANEMTASTIFPR